MPCPVIDMWAPIVPARETMAYVAHHYPEPQLGYLRAVFKTPPELGAFEKLANATKVFDRSYIPFGNPYPSRYVFDSNAFASASFAIVSPSTTNFLPSRVPMLPR